MRASRLIAGLVVVALVATVVFAVTQSLAADDGGSTGDPGLPRRRRWPRPRLPSPAPASRPTADLASFYGQTWTGRSVRGEVECATLTVPVDYQHPDGETIDSPLLRDPADDPGRADRLAGRRPRRPRRPGTSYAENRRSRSGDVLRDALRHRRHRPARRRRVRCRSTASPTRSMDAYLAGDPDPDTPEEGPSSRPRTRGSPGCEANVRQTWRLTSPRSRRRATWTCCGRPSARRS